MKQGVRGCSRVDTISRVCVSGEREREREKKPFPSRRHHRALESALLNFESYPNLEVYISGNVPRSSRCRFTKCKSQPCGRRSPGRNHEGLRATGREGAPAIEHAQIKQVSAASERRGGGRGGVRLRVGHRLRAGRGRGRPGNVLKDLTILKKAPLSLSLFVFENPS